MPYGKNMAALYNTLSHHLVGCLAPISRGSVLVKKTKEPTGIYGGRGANLTAGTEMVPPTWSLVHEILVRKKNSINS